MKLLLNSTTTALWREVVHEAQGISSTPLKEEVEAYLVLLLIRYTTHPEAIKQIIATEFLKGVQQGTHQRELVFQNVGDRCLIFSGLFPGIAEKRLVKINYFVNIGKAAYFAISKTHNDLYSTLSLQFVSLMDVLQSIRTYDKQFADLLPLQAYDQWSELGSQRGLQVLRKYTDAIPIQK